MQLNLATELLRAEADQHGIELSATALCQIRQYLAALEAYNEKVNLVADADPVNVAKRHVLDALALNEFITQAESHGKLVDIGTGAGLPGLILAIVNPELEVVLLDSIAKKTRFLEETLAALTLEKRVSVVTGRAEDLAATAQRASFKIATSRALGHLGLVAELAMPLLEEGGRLLCPKSERQSKLEIEALDKLSIGLGAGRAQVLTPKIQVADNQHVVVSIEKRKATSDKFPRPWAEIIRQWK